MPELPEVETIKRGLLETVLNKEIIDAKIILSKSFVNKKNIDFKGKINEINRVGKYIIIKIKDKCSIVIHLRMTGKLIYLKSIDEIKDNHVRFIFYLNDGSCLLFNDVRTFGQIEIYPPNINILKIKNIGADALSEAFTLEYFEDILKKRKTPIKNLLLNQSIIAGIGNIYAMEILFASKVSPLKYSHTLTKKQIQIIYNNIKHILNLAILHNGTSISDFRNIDDKTGEFQNFLKIYGKKICPECNNTLWKTLQNNRTTLYCKNCQES